MEVRGDELSFVDGDDVSTETRRGRVRIEKISEDKIPMIEQFPGLEFGRYRIVYADPAWKYKAFSNKGEGRSAQRHYNVMTIADMCALPVADLCDPRGALLFMWVAGPFMDKAFTLAKAWGFKYSAVAFVWVKLKRIGPPLLFHENAFHLGMGHTTRKNAEFVLLFKRGRPPARKARTVRELIFAPVREHSRKPDETLERIEQYADGPYVELFARRRRDGWHSWGDQLPPLGKE